MRALLISTYELGRQPFGLASAAAALRARGVEARCLDLSRQRLEEVAVRDSDAVAFHLPMHTATRLALPVIARVRAINPGARLCAYGLYAPLNAALLRQHGVHEIVGAEFEDDLPLAVLGASRPGHGAQTTVPRVRFRVPERDTLPPLSRYATLQLGARRMTVGYTEGSRGCKHRCRHCPIVPVYDGRFRIVPIPIVLADVRAQVAAGAEHVTFGDPDFFNGVRHAADLVRAFAAEFPGITYDVTIKIEHLLRHAGSLSLLKATGCLFVTSAVEAVDDATLQKLDKGHTRADFERAVALCRESGVALAPTFVPFTPWTTRRGYCELLQAVDALDLVDRVAPIQLAIRLLIPEGSRLLELEEVRGAVGPYAPDALAYPWRHRDPGVDALQRRVERLAGRSLGADRAALFAEVWDAAHEAAGLRPPPRREQGALPRAAIPYLNEPWYC